MKDLLNALKVFVFCFIITSLVVYFLNYRPDPSVGLKPFIEALIISFFASLGWYIGGLFKIKKN